MRPQGCSSFTTFHKISFGRTFAEGQHHPIDRRRCPSRRSLIASTLQPERVRDRYGLDARHADYQPELWQGEEQPSLFPLQ